MTGSPLRILFLGTPEYAVPSLERLVADGYDVVRVYTRPDQPAGRSGAPTASAVKRAALRHGLSVRQPRSLRAAVELQQLRELAPDLLVVAAYGLILPQEILEIPRYKSLNVHPSLLPQHRGASPIAGALLAGDAETGVTIMLMDAGMDTGPILTQRRVAIGPADTSGSLTTRLAQVGAELLSETIPLWVGDELRPQPQDETQATYTRLLTKADGQVDWSQPAHLIARQAQAYQPWPGLYTRWQARQLKLLQVEALPDVTSPGQRPEPGAVVPLGADLPIGQAGAAVQTGRGLLRLLVVQLEGKRPLNLPEFLRGARGFVGSRLESPD